MGLQKKINDRKWRAREQPLQPGSECFVTEFLINTPPPEECCYHTHTSSRTTSFLLSLPTSLPQAQSFPDPSLPIIRELSGSEVGLPQRALEEECTDYRPIDCCVYVCLVSFISLPGTGKVNLCKESEGKLEAYPEFQIDPTPTNLKGLS